MQVLKDMLKLLTSVSNIVALLNFKLSFEGFQLHTNYLKDSSNFKVHVQSYLKILIIEKSSIKK